MTPQQMPQFLAALDSAAQTLGEGIEALSRFLALDLEERALLVMHYRALESAISGGPEKSVPAFSALFDRVLRQLQQREEDPVLRWHAEEMLEARRALELAVSGDPGENL